MSTRDKARLVRAFLGGESIQDLAYPLVWRVRTRLPERFGQRCRVFVRGAMNSCAVQFERDGYCVVTSRWYVRRAR